MRIRSMCLYVLVSLCIATHAETSAQSFSIGEAVEIVYPGLTVSVVREQPRTYGQDVCYLQGTLWECNPHPQANMPSGGFTIGVDAAGSVYHLAANGQGQLIDFGGGRSGFLLQRITAAGQTETLARLLIMICLDESCTQNKQFAGLHPTLDVTNGRIVVAVMAILVVGISPNPINVGVVQIDGLPKLIDTISLPTPCPDADADGFRDCVTMQGCFPYGGACGDCNDANPTINPRGSETTPKANRHDGKDNDCNGVVDG